MSSARQWETPLDLKVTAPSHYRNCFSHPADFQKLVVRVSEALFKLKEKLPFDAIATCGLSGNILGAAVSHHIGIPLVVVRKDKESSGHGCKVTGILTGRVVVIDDLIDGGGTMNHLLSELKRTRDYWEGLKQIRGALTPVGILLYQSRFSSKWEEKRMKKHDPLPVFYLDDIEHDMSWPDIPATQLDLPTPEPTPRGYKIEPPAVEARPHAEDDALITLNEPLKMTEYRYTVTFVNDQQKTTLPLPPTTPEPVRVDAPKIDWAKFWDDNKTLGDCWRTKSLTDP